MRVNQNQLNELSIELATPKQKAVIEKLQETGFRIFRAKWDGPVACVLLTHPNTFGVVYPDGSFHRALKGKKTVTIDWSRARALYEMNKD